MLKLKKKQTSLEEFKEKLIREYNENKFNMNSEDEKKFHNELSIIFNYEFDSGNENYIHRISLYNLISSMIIKNYTLDIIHHANKYLSEKYNINNLKFNELKDKSVIEKFQSELSIIKNERDEKLIKWISHELIEQTEFFESTLFIDHIDKFIRTEKITNNSKRKLEELEISNKYNYALKLFDIFYNFKDKLLKNNIIGKNNKVKLLILNSKRNKNNNWKIESKNEISQKRHYTFEDHQITEERKVSLQNKYVKTESETKKINYVKEGGGE